MDVVQSISKMSNSLSRRLNHSKKTKVGQVSARMHAPVKLAKLTTYLYNGSVYWTKYHLLKCTWQQYIGLTDAMKFRSIGALALVIQGIHMKSYSTGWTIEEEASVGALD